MRKLTISLHVFGIAWLAAVVSHCNYVLADTSSDDAVAAIAELITDKDKDVRALGMQQVREEAKGADATKKFAAMLPKLPSSLQVELLGALAARGDKTARTAVLDCLKSGEPSVRVAAILAMGPLGETADVPLVAKKLASADKAERNAAETSLTQFCGTSINSAVAAEMKSASPDVRVLLIRVLEQRRAVDNVPDILEAVQDSNPNVRSAAMAALGRFAGPEHVASMVKGVLTAKPGADREAAERVVTVACNREKDVEKRAVPLLAVWKNLNADEKTDLLPTLGRVGGSETLKIVEAAIADTDSRQHEAGIRAICNWPDVSVASKLFDLAKNAKTEDNRRMAIMALARVATTPDKRTPVARLELLKQVMKLATTDEQRNYIIKRASGKSVRIVESLRFVLPYLDKPENVQAACTTVVVLAHYRELREPNKVEFNNALDKVLAICKDADLLDCADRYKKGQTRALPTPPASDPSK